MDIVQWVSQRAVGNNSPNDQVQSLTQRMVLNKLSHVHSSQFGNPTPSNSSDTSASVFGLEYLNHNTLLSSHSDGLIRVHDYRIHKLVATSPKTHLDAVNGCTKVGSDGYFASFSDDNSALVWDVRKFTQHLKKLTGHTSWVKNVNVLSDGKTLITSGCDQTIRKYNIDTSKEIIDSKPLLFFDGLCRVKLQPVKNVLLLSTTKTTVFKILNLNLDTLENDVINYFNDSVKQNNKEDIPPFSDNRNQVKLVHYVPFHGFCTGQSLDIHPLGSCCAVRHCRCTDDLTTSYPYIPTEWLSVYDMCNINIPNVTKPRRAPKRRRRNQWPEDEEDEDENPIQEDEMNAGVAEKFWGNLSAHEQLPVWERMELSNKVEHDALKELKVTNSRIKMLYQNWLEGNNDLMSMPQVLKDVAYFKRCKDYLPGIIKEVSFSPNGNLLTNPTRYGFEVLGFNEELSNYKRRSKSENVDGPRQLTLVKKFVLEPGSDCVCAKFAPDGLTIVAGEMDGKLSWLRPL